MTTSHRSAFTLIEMMMAITAGLGVVMIAFAGVRGANEALQKARSMTTETELLAVGVQQSYRELDYWDAYDDRSAPANDTTGRHALRGVNPTPLLPAPTSASGRVGTYVFGLPFAALSDYWGPKTLTLGNVRQNYGNHSWLGLLNPTDADEEAAWAISAANPLTYWTGNVLEGFTTKPAANQDNERVGSSCLKSGYYAIFGTSLHFPLPASGLVVGSPPPNFPGSPSFRRTDSMTNPSYGYGDVKSIPSLFISPIGSNLSELKTSGHVGWLFNHMRGLKAALGYYGMLDYLPVNLLPRYYAADDVELGQWLPGNAGPVEAAGVDPSSFMGPYLSYRTWGSTVYSNHNPGRFLYLDNLLIDSAYALIPWCSTQTLFNGAISPYVDNITPNLVFYHHNGFAQLYEYLPNANTVTNSTDPLLMRKYIDRTTGTMRISQTRPSDWPDVIVNCAHYTHRSRFYSFTTVTWNDPMSGASRSLQFAGMGTTLRGARRQRTTLSGQGTGVGQPLDR